MKRTNLPFKSSATTGQAVTPPHVQLINYPDNTVCSFRSLLNRKCLGATTHGSINSHDAVQREDAEFSQTTVSR